MFICENCGHEFEYPDIAEDFVSECWGIPCHHMLSVCPVCRSDEIKEMKKCEMCGEYIPPGEEICENCSELIRDCAGDVKGRVKYVSLKYRLNYDEFMSHLITELDK